MRVQLIRVFFVLYPTGLWTSTKFWFWRAVATDLLQTNNYYGTHVDSDTCANGEQASFLQYPATVLNSLQGKWYANELFKDREVDFPEARKKGRIQRPFTSFIKVPLTPKYFFR